MRKEISLFVVMLLVAAMILPVCATEVASVRQPGAPVVSEVDDETVNVMVIPLAEQENTSWQVQQEMQKATDALHEGDLTQVAGVEEALKTINEDIAGTPTAEDPEIKAEDLVVSEVFHVIADRAGITVTFEAEGIKADQFLMVMIFVDGEWIVLDADAYEILEDGKIQIFFEHLGTVAFVVKKSEINQVVPAAK